MTNNLFFKNRYKIMAATILVAMSLEILKTDTNFLAILWMITTCIWVANTRLAERKYDRTIDFLVEKGIITCDKEESDEERAH